MALIAAAVTAAWPVTTASQSATPRPSLLVLVVVDQMRADYVERYGARWSGGLRRLYDQGAVQSETYYPYLNTVTCAGHATLGTGAWPTTHGAIMNVWYDRDLAAQRTCTHDPSVTTYTYGGPSDRPGHSAAALRVPTLAERLRQRWRQSRAVSMSLKPRSAIMMAGKGATSVTWWGEPGWQSSTAFGRPRPEIDAFVTAHPPASELTAMWDRRLALDAYIGADDGVGERPARGWTALFPHPLNAPGAERPDALWEESPFSDAYLGRMAAAAIRDFRLGQRGVVDFLGVSFSATDLVGHSFGPASHEVQDVLVRLDATIGMLLETLDRLVGRDRYALALSADHGVAEVPEVARAAGQSAGRVPLASVRATVEKVLAEAQPGPHVARVEYTQIYLTPAARARASAAALAPVLSALRATPGIAAAVWNDDLEATAGGAPAAVLDAIRASYVPGRSGDLTIVPAPGWILIVGGNPNGGDGTTHGSLNPYDQHVPLVFYGAAFTPGRSEVRATPADAAPTLAATVGLPMRNVQGRVVRHALRGTGTPR
jgi:arylsulfatase A-like enzyme